jgi:hypothetical protein
VEQRRGPVLRRPADADRHVRQHEIDLADWARNRREGRGGDGVFGPPQLRGNRFFDLDIRVHDDVGTDYRIMGGSSGGSVTEWLGHSSRPRLPKM